MDENPNLDRNDSVKETGNSQPSNQSDQYNDPSNDIHVQIIKFEPNIPSQNLKQDQKYDEQVIQITENTKIPIIIENQNVQNQITQDIPIQTNETSDKKEENNNLETKVENNSENKNENQNLATKTDTNTASVKEIINPKIVPILQFDDVIKLYSASQVNQNLITPVEIFKLSQINRVFKSQESLQSNLYTIFHQLNSPGFMDIEMNTKKKPKGKPGRHPKYQIYEYSESDGNSSVDEPYPQDTIVVVKQRPPSTQGQSKSQQRKARMVPVKKMTIFDITNRRYAPWIEITGKAPRRPPKGKNRNNVPKEMAADIIYETFDKISKVKLNETPSKAMNAIAADPSLALALGPQYEMNEEDKKMLHERGQIKLRDKNAFAFKLLPVSKSETASIPSHSVLRRIYKEGRADNMSNLSRMERHLNTVEKTPRIARVKIGDSDFQKVANYLWPAPPKQPAHPGRGGRTSKQLDNDKKSGAAKLAEVEHAIDASCMISNETIIAQATMASHVLHSSFEPPFWLNFEYEKQQFRN